MTKGWGRKALLGAGAALLAAGCATSAPQPSPTATNPAAANPSPHAKPTQRQPQIKLGGFRVHGVFGYDQTLTEYSDAEREAVLEQAKAAGAKIIRVNIDWRFAEKAPGDYYYDDWDPTIKAILKKGLIPYIVFGYAPDWAAGRCEGLCAPKDTPAIREAYGRFAEALASHYNNVRLFEPWNEANHPRFWPGPDPVVYAGFYQEAYNGIKRANPKAAVLFSGLANDSPDSPYEFLRKMYKKYPKIRTDCVNVHPYLRGAPPKLADAKTVNLDEAPKDAWEGTPYMQRLASDHANRDVPVCITEFGYPTGSGSDDVTEGEQSRFTQAALKEFQSQPWSGMFLYYTLKDSTDLREPRWGMISSKGEPKQAYNDLVELARS